MGTAPFIYLTYKIQQMLLPISLSLGRCGKLAHRFFGPFEILAKKGPMAYELALPAHIRVHNSFHASLLKKYVYDTKHVIDWFLLQWNLKGSFPLNPFIYWTRDSCNSESAP